jgi:aspartyl-tRNA(Asn)/glutamyl-tRNA(Gln) amidotransferase subunit B
MQLKVGLEIHGYIQSDTKLFCDCAIREGAVPNTHICPRCTGQPGSKPLATQVQALHKSVQIGLLLGCTINPRLVFERKHYNWPDSPNNYQRTMSGTYASPVGEHGLFEGIHIKEVHLEEDPAKWDPITGHVDYNRAGYPLIEIVTEPDFTSADQVRDWLEALLTTLSYIKAINRVAGIKCDVNVSIGPAFERVEIKNVNSLSGIVDAILYEQARQTQEKTLGNAIVQQTRTWDDEKKQTIFMRSKESAQDYMFIPDPDIAAMDIDETLITQLKSSLPDAPSAKKQKLLSLGVKEEDARVICSRYVLIDMFEYLSATLPFSVFSSYLRRETLSVSNYHKKDIDDLNFDKVQLLSLFTLLSSGKITDKVAKKLLERLLIEPFDVAASVKEQGLETIQDTNKIDAIVTEVLTKNPKAVEDYKAGNEVSLNFLVGQIMRQLKGAAKPDVVLAKVKSLL